jgi:hypothetical protein
MSTLVHTKTDAQWFEMMDDVVFAKSLGQAVFEKWQRASATFMNENPGKLTANGYAEFIRPYNEECARADEEVWEAKRRLLAAIKHAIKSSYGLGGRA